MRRTLSGALWSVTDQAILAISGFTLNLVLARAMNAEIFGSFTTAYASFLLFAGFYNALVIEPAFILGSNRYATSFLGYTRKVGRAQLPLALLVVSAPTAGIGVLVSAMGGNT